MEILLMSRCFIECIVISLIIANNYVRMIFYVLNSGNSEEHYVRLEVFTAGTMKNGVFWYVTRRVALVRTEVSEELIATFIRVTRIGELGTTLAVTSNRRTLRRNTK
jgi:hypothetical protein